MQLQPVLEFKCPRRRESFMRMAEVCMRRFLLIGLTVLLSVPVFAQTDFSGE
jgi:hypothetical protein